MSLRSSAAQLSRIQKPGQNKKSLINPLYKKVNKNGSHGTKPGANEDKVSKKDPLEVSEHNIQMDFRLQDVSSIVKAINLVIRNQWAESTLCHDRYFSHEVKINSKTPSDLLFLLRGISMEGKADINKYRHLQLPTGGMLTVNQLYTLFESKGNTYVDRSLELFVRNSQVRKFIITNALPVILRTGKGGLNNQVTYGYENAEVVVNTEQYLNEISDTILQADTEVASIMAKFREHILNNPTALFVTNQDFSADELSSLVTTGFLTLTSNHHFEIDVHQYSIAYPRCGTFLKMINSGRTWLVKTLYKTTYKESLEENLFNKWEGKIMANFRKPFYGYDLLWILADAKGAGFIEAFNTPVGRGWRLTGKL
ncbi:hypothetical protein METBIDRAFT_79376 [Metschnikowia bicuspidata var. bicuspidata NRRL YB-4993]|uniref:Uncharacterized protein n=1 Tax=Metschnikowia bicuspidata var. bicuspidata NRRL YB-4993 TaxID=869754 RepID=A0A1A0H7W4_9ASCO|nr:hypothetical protein METBIDRAFT_79376 [Metschnikowia bicuspidata var. bicuspidata NRRL YB-4993]OBA20075.1 hypothetical protein METBIDRAFT_79376 [Metschnikowia bicuspidata var. bicuspidata NRRL YB-4993]